MKKIKYTICYVMCMVLMLLWSTNVFAADDVSVSFNILNDSEINLSEDNTLLTITASSTSVTDFDVYVNKEFYKNLEGKSVTIDLKTLNKLGSVYLEAYANGTNGVLAEGSISLTLADVLKDYLYQKDMEDLVEGVFWDDTQGTFTNGYLEPVVIDEEHGTSMLIGAADGATGVNLWFGAKALTRTDVTRAVFECDVRFTGSLKETYLATPAVNTGLLWNLGVSAANSMGGLTPDEWHHVKWVLDMDNDTYSFTIDGNDVSILNAGSFDISAYSYVTGHFRFTIEPVSGENLDFVIDNIEYYAPANSKPAPKITEVADNDGNNVVAQNSQYVKVTLTDDFGTVTKENIKLVNTNGEQAIENVTVNTENTKELYIYPKNGFISGDEYYLTLKKDTLLNEGKLPKDICYKFNTLAKDIDFNGGVVVKKAGKVNYTFKLTNKTTNNQTVCLLMYTNVNDMFTKLTPQEIEVPAGAENEPYSISAEDMVEGAVGYGLIVTNINDLTPISNKLIVSKSN